MADYKAKQCDQCGAVIEVAEATKYTQRFEGPQIDHERTFDLCGECLDKFELDLVEHTGLKPIHRRKRKADTPSETVPSVPPEK